MVKTMAKTFSVKDAVWSAQLIGVLREFRKVHPNITANQIITLLSIAQSEGSTQRELEQSTGIDKANVSRICALFSNGLGTQDGYGITRDERDPDDRRLFRQYLTSKGRDVIDTVRSIMTR